MAEIVFSDGTVVSDYGKPYIVAELNTSHRGDLNEARRMIDTATEIGCDCVKFQSWSEHSLYSESYYKENPIARRFVSKFSLSADQLRELSEYTQSRGIGFSSTPYSPEEVDFLVDHCNAPFVKIASMDLTNLPYLEYVARKQVPIVLSTGMGDITEIAEAVDTVRSAGNTNLVILHCVSVYPVEAEAVNLNNILELRERFPEFPVGYSDHTLGTEVAAASIALGACMVEKHFTLDNSKIGMDNQMATEPEQMAQLVKECHNVHKGLGRKTRSLSSDEIEQRDTMRRSVVATRDLDAGTVLSPDDLTAKRPGTGIPPKEIGSLIGKRLTRAVKKDYLLQPDDLVQDQ